VTFLLEAYSGISSSACQNQLLVDDEHGKEVVGVLSLYTLQRHILSE